MNKCLGKRQYVHTRPVQHLGLELWDVGFTALSVQHVSRAPLRALSLLSVYGLVTDFPWTWSEPLCLHPPMWVQQGPHPATALVNSNPAHRCCLLLAAWGQCPENPTTALPQLCSPACLYCGAGCSQCWPCSPDLNHSSFEAPHPSV